MAAAQGRKAASKKAIEVDGIEVTPAVDPGDDYRLTELMLTRFDEDADLVSRNRATIESYRIILGGDYDRVVTELAEKHGGKLTNATMAEFMNKVILGSRELKNSEG